MDVALISGKEPAEENCSDHDAAVKVLPGDVEMEETKSGSPRGTARPKETDEGAAERLRPVSAPGDGENICAVCGFSAKCPRSLKIHFTRMHGKNSKNNRTAKPAEENENASDEIQQEVEMETESAGKMERNQGRDGDELRAAGGVDTSGTTGKETLPDTQQADREEAVPTQERRVSKRTPKPKMIHSCNYCGQEFRDKSPLDVHMQRYHTKDTPYTCEYELLHKLERALGRAHTFAYHKIGH